MINQDSNTKNNLNRKNQPPMVTHKILQRYIPIVVINLLVILVLGYFISPWSKVGTITVEGNEFVYVQTVIDESGIRTGDSMIEIQQNLDTISEQITQEIPQISDSHVQVLDINHVLLQIEEYSTVAYIARDESYLRVLENGTVLDDAYDVSIGNQPVLSNFEEGEALNLVIEQMSQLDPAILHLISEIELVENRANPLFIQAYMNNGNRVLSSIPSFSEKIAYYPQMVQAVKGLKGVFDMEVGVYFIPFVTQENVDENTEVDEMERQELEGFNR
ncbi:MAG TPA: cell division protein FtsQ/DivIB [Atopostipes sp.]|nr:cell division protein FtsQ/DivIB [Atopostipes sp.]